MNSPIRKSFEYQYRIEKVDHLVTADLIQVTDAFNISSINRGDDELIFELSFSIDPELPIMYSHSPRDLMLIFGKDKRHRLGYLKMGIFSEIKLEENYFARVLVLHASEVILQGGDTSHHRF